MKRFKGTASNGDGGRCIKKNGKTFVERGWSGKEANFLFTNIYLCLAVWANVVGCGGNPDCGAFAPAVDMLK